MTPYDANFKGLHILFPKEDVKDTLAEYLSKNGKRQPHTAETEKYAHVTFFLNGGREEPFAGETAYSCTRRRWQPMTCSRR